MRIDPALISSVSPQVWDGGELRDVLWPEADLPVDGLGLQLELEEVGEEAAERPAEHRAVEHDALARPHQREAAHCHVGPEVVSL